MSKRFLVPSDFWDTGLLEQWLEEKAAQGWMPVSFSGYSSGKFEKSQPQALRFRLEPDRPETYEEQCDREDAYREMGWQFAAVLGDYRVYYTRDPAAPELYTDPGTQCWAWERLLRKFRRNCIIALALLAVWTVLQFSSIWEKGTPVQLFLYGMWVVWLWVLSYFVRELAQNVRVLRGVRRVRRQLEAGIPLDHGGDLARSLRRRRRQEAVSWAMIALMAVLVVSVLRGGRSMDLAEAPAPRPWVAMETLDPDTGDLKMDWARYKERRGLLVPFSCETEQWQWDFGPHLEARYDRTLLPAFARALYQERLDVYIKNHPNAAVETLNDPRFDGAALVTGRSANDTKNIQAFVAYKGKAVVYQTIAMDADLGDNIDDFAAILAEFQ